MADEDRAADERSGGDRLRAALAEDDDPADLVALIEEAGRTKDRLDQLDAILRGDTDLWAQLTEGRTGTVLEVRVDSVMQEARQLTTVFRQTLAEIRRRRDGGSSFGAKIGNILDDL
ncbi:hypothetical protein OVA21_03985 [Dietzia sp. SL131]|uniref:hypothetical protein n=1 Tax=Dietzia sp. SL131 TaxID=2995149 RepID=UPI00227B93F3|nr:hypothetical protein [Dietzia sp. SL131]MCY1656381.1 hypothetical protein [Dietzia sp. SL131]